MRRFYVRLLVDDGSQPARRRRRGLVAHKFKSGSVGLVSCSDFNTWLIQRPRGFWQRLKYWFSIDKEPVPVVCIPPGAQLQVFAVSRSLQKQFNLRECEEVTFAEISVQERQHRDALCFGNGLILRLGLLPEGQRLRVLRLSSREDVEPDGAECGPKGCSKGFRLFSRSALGRPALLPQRMRCPRVFSVAATPRKVPP